MTEQRNHCTGSIKSSEQHRLDLEVLSRIENQRECFFDVMGELDALELTQ
jgi:hypothetical protein